MNRLALRIGALVLALLGVAGGAAASPVGAQAPEDAHARAATVPEPGVLPGLAAVVPGVLLHGAGTYLANDRRTSAAVRAGLARLRID
ncbi:MAG: hypothetical protein ABW252_02100 [Polyangiales bacterium]